MILFQADDSAFQLGQVLDGWPVDAFDAKPFETAMSARVQIGHLAECYVALAAELTGTKYEWGSWATSTSAPEDAVVEMWDLRNKAIAIATTQDTEESIKLIASFVVAHDYYHIGQLSSIRIAVDPEWNPYSIYRQ